MEKFLKLTAGSNVTLLNASSIQFVATTLANPTLVDVLYAAGGATAGSDTIRITSSTTTATAAEQVAFRDAIYDAIELANRASSNPDSFIVPVLPAGITIASAALN
jgi:hypothetical protein